MAYRAEEKVTTTTKTATTIKIGGITIKKSEETEEVEEVIEERNISTDGAGSNPNEETKNIKGRKKSKGENLKDSELKISEDGKGQVSGVNLGANKEGEVNKSNRSEIEDDRHNKTAGKDKRGRSSDKRSKRLNSNDGYGKDSAYGETSDEDQFGTTFEILHEEYVSINQTERIRERRESFLYPILAPNAIAPIEEPAPRPKYILKTVNFEEHCQCKLEPAVSSDRSESATNCRVLPEHETVGPCEMVCRMCGKSYLAGEEHECRRKVFKLW